MRKRFCLFVLAFCLLLTGCAPAAEPDPDPTPAAEASAPGEAPASREPAGPELPQREQDWIEDIEFLREEYKTRHPDPFYLYTEAEFDWKMDQLTAKVGGLSDSDIFYELNSIITGMGDTHTKLLWDASLPIYDRLFAITMVNLNGRLYVASYLEGYEQFEPYLLREIVGVNGVDTLYFMGKAAGQYQPYNWHSEVNFPFYPSFFDWVGCDYKEGYTFQILNGNHEVESVEVPVVPYDEGMAGTWIRPENWDALVFAKGGDRTAYYEGKDGGCIQWCIGEMWYVSNIWSKLKEVAALMEEHPDCNKLAIDLRQCPGGSAKLGSFLDEIRNKSELLEGKDIYVLTWGNTASAATKMIAFLKDEFGAVTVGEPTGEFSSFYSRGEERERTPTILPHSNIRVHISDRWRDSTELLQELNVAPIYEEYYNEDGRIYPWETCILPDVYIHQDIEDLRQGKDTVLEWVLAQ